MSRTPRMAKTRSVPATRPAPRWTSLAAGAACLALYLAWAPPVSGDKDGSEFTAVLATLGLAHPTGYALYTLLGHVFVLALHALGARWAYAANAWSAVGGAVAIGLWHAFAARLLVREGVAGPRSAALALLPALAFGLDPAWTAETTLAEVNSWHGAWAAGACLVALATLEQLPVRRGDQGWVRRRAAAWGLLAGLGLAHHATSVLFAVPLTAALLVAARPLRLSWLLPGASALLPPLLAWSYVYYRSIHPAAVEWGSLGPGLHETWNHVTAAGYRHYLGSFSPSARQQAELASYVYPWLVPGLVAATLWPFARSAQSRAARFGFAGAALLQTAYPFAYGVADPVPYFLPALALGTFVLPAALACVAPVRSFARPLATAAGCGLAVAAWFWGSAAAGRSAALVQVESMLHTMWSAVPLQRGYVLWDADMCYRLVEYQQLAREKPGLVVVRPQLLMDAGARQLFARRHGFDPLAGAEPPAEAEADRPERIRAFADQIAEGINRSTPDSVILFLPEEPALRLLPKPPASGR